MFIGDDKLLELMWIIDGNGVLKYDLDSLVYIFIFIFLNLESEVQQLK